MYRLAFQILIALFVEFVKSQETLCAESQKHFADLCFQPKPLPFSAIDLKWIIESQPSDGWHCILGNDIARLHYAEGLRGELLSSADNFDDLCFKATVEHGENPNEAPSGQYFGYGNLTSDWSCKFSADFPGQLLCDDVNPGVTKYHENYNYHVSYTDNKNFQVAIICFSNGQVGWLALSVSQTFSEVEQKFIMDHITSLGFSKENTVTLYNDESCSNDN